MGSKVAFEIGPKCIRNEPKPDTDYDVYVQTHCTDVERKSSRAPSDKTSMQPEL